MSPGCMRFIMFGLFIASNWLSMPPLAKKLVSGLPKGWIVVGPIIGPKGMGLYTIWLLSPLRATGGFLGGGGGVGSLILILEPPKGFIKSFTMFCTGSLEAMREILTLKPKPPLA